MEFKYEQTREGLLALLADLAGPWGESMSFAGFGTPFQNEIAKYPDILDAVAAVDTALAHWATAVDPVVVHSILAEIITNRPGPDFHNNIVVRRQEAWEDAIEQVKNALVFRLTSYDG